MARSHSAAEAELRRLALELHDELAQTLAAVRVELRVARATADADRREARFDRISAGLGEVIEDVRRLAQGLRPASLGELGIGAALGSYARPVAEAAGMEIDIQTVPTAGAITDAAELVLYRIMQEAMANVVRHSGASRVDLILRRTGRSLELCIADNGRGFDVAEALRGDGRGLGLLGMQERARHVGGSVETFSVPGDGTRITVTVPLAE
jgi:two-component system sensor histidine kinase UhpB